MRTSGRDAVQILEEVGRTCRQCKAIAQRWLCRCPPHCRRGSKLWHDLVLLKALAQDTSRRSHLEMSLTTPMLRCTVTQGCTVSHLRVLQSTVKAAGGLTRAGDDLDAGILQHRLQLSVHLVLVALSQDDDGPAGKAA